MAVYNCSDHATLLQLNSQSIVRVRVRFFHIQDELLQSNVEFELEIFEKFQEIRRNIDLKREESKKEFLKIKEIQLSKMLCHLILVRIRTK